MLQCARCHPSGEVKAASADLAPSLLLAHDRLRYDWVPEWIKDPQAWVPGTRMPNFFSKGEHGEILSQVHLQVAAPVFAAQKQQLLRYFASEAEMTAYLADSNNVATALRDHIWLLSGGGRRPSAPAGSSVVAPAPVTAGAAGGR
jgi:hypothetical protein